MAHRGQWQAAPMQIFHNGHSTLGLKIMPRDHPISPLVTKKRGVDLVHRLSDSFRWIRSNSVGNTRGMTKLGKRLVKAARQAREIARGTVDPKTYRVSLGPMHPGEVLREEFLKPMKLSIAAAADKTKIPAKQLAGIANEKKDITADSAKKLARAFGTTPDFCLNLQAHFEILARCKPLRHLFALLHPRQVPAVL
jgi:addiction module HigA family antidote